jgi:hypothetical protein
MFINHLVSLIQKNVGKVLRLRKALYGLKQAPRLGMLEHALYTGKVLEIHNC